MRKILRREFENKGAEAIARQRLQMCVDRFVDVKRVGSLEYRDNRTDNEFFLAEIFEIKNFLKDDGQSSWCKLEITAESVANLLPLPISAPRHAPLALPHPCRMVHIMEVYCVSLPPAIVQQRTIENPWLRFTRLRKTLAGYWTVTTTLETLTDFIPPDGIDEFREAVREIRAQSAWSLQVPAGQARPFQRSDFGRLPVAWEATPSAFPRASKQAPPPRTGALSPAVQFQPPSVATTPASAASPLAAESASHSGQPGQVQWRRRKRHRRRSREDKKVVIWQAIFASLLVMVVLLLALQFFKRTSSIIKPPPTPDEIEPNH